MAGIAQRRLAHLDRERLREPQEVLLQRRAGRHRPPKVIGPDPQTLARGLNEALVRGSIRTQEDRAHLSAPPGR